MTVFKISTILVSASAGGGGGVGCRSCGVPVESIRYFFFAEPGGIFSLSRGRLDFATVVTSKDSSMSMSTMSTVSPI